VPIWVTEYALNNSTLKDSQAFFNASLTFLDSQPIVERYSYFGSFRSKTSNIGPNVAMLDANGQLTDVGSWYLGGVATGNIPSSATRLINVHVLLVAVATNVIAGLLFNGF
jgi:Glycosyl hydrolase catalytic core